MRWSKAKEPKEKRTIFVKTLRRKLKFSRFHNMNSTINRIVIEPSYISAPVQSQDMDFQRQQRRMKSSVPCMSPSKCPLLWYCQNFKYTL